MAALDFPGSPTTGQTYTPTGGNTYVYDGTKWVISTTAKRLTANLKSGDTSITIADTGTGNIVIAADAANVAYITAAAGVVATDSLLTFFDTSDPTKKAKFELSNITTGNTRTFTFTDLSGQFVTPNGLGTLSNKTLVTPDLTIKDANLSILASADVTKIVKLDLSGLTTAQTKTLTVPDGNSNVLLASATQTVSNTTFTNTTALTITDANLTLQNSTDITKQVKISLTGITTGTTKTLTLPDANTTLIGIDTIDTLTNKTIGAVTVSGTLLFNENVLLQPQLQHHSINTEDLGTLTGTGTTNVNIANASYFSATMTANARTFAFINPPSTTLGTTFFMELTNPGQATITWPTGVKWPGGTAPALTGTGVDVFAFSTRDAGTTYRGAYIMKDSK